MQCSTWLGSKSLTSHQLSHITLQIQIAECYQVQIFFPLLEVLYVLVFSCPFLVLDPKFLQQGVLGLGGLAATAAFHMGQACMLTTAWKPPSSRGPLSSTTSWRMSATKTCRRTSRSAPFSFRLMAGPSPAAMPTSFSLSTIA